MTVPGQSNVARGVTEWYSVCFAAENSVVKSHPVNFLLIFIFMCFVIRVQI